MYIIQTSKVTIGVSRENFSNQRFSIVIENQDLKNKSTIMIHIISSIHTC